jgi:hypothetical protein
MPAQPEPRPMTWRQIVDVVETVDSRLRDVLTTARRMSVPTRERIEQIVREVTTPVLIRERRRAASIRQLDESGRAIVAARLETIEQGRPGRDANLHVYQPDAAEFLNVSPRLVSSAKTAFNSEDPDLIADVDASNVSASAAVSKVDTSRRRKSVEKWPAGQLEAVHHQVRSQPASTPHLVSSAKTALNSDRERLLRQRSYMRAAMKNADLPPDLRAQARSAADNADAALRLDAASKRWTERDQTRVGAKEQYEALPMEAQP